MLHLSRHAREKFLFLKCLSQGVRLGHVYVWLPSFFLFTVESKMNLLVHIVLDINSKHKKAAVSSNRIGQVVPIAGKCLLIPILLHKCIMCAHCYMFF